ncbi:hypothetical protein TNCV_2664631 [Trichonephila clavipes]|nr:hypothetical protein TNCV_2664631 [Trichonephila clavipes]
MDMVDAWSPAEDSDLKNQHRVTAQGSLPFGSAGNLMTHPAIYESNDPQAWECFGTPGRRNSTVHTFHHSQQGYEFRNDVYVDRSVFLNELPCKAVSKSATFLFTMDALPDCFLSATDPMLRNRCTKRDTVVAFCAVSPEYFY